jgi:hypothetical protein
LTFFTVGVGVARATFEMVFGEKWFTKNAFDRWS